MYADNFSLEQYFKRIGLDYGQLHESPINSEMLTRIMRQQLFNVPFENLDVQSGKIVSLVPEKIVEKILFNQRGGYCYEVNGIFAMALQALNIPYRLVAARPMFYPTRRPRTHMVIIATLEDEQWLCDLGFGSYGIRAPIRLSGLNLSIPQEHDQFRLSKVSEHEYLLQAWVSNEWANQFAFDLSPQEWVDFEPANYMNSTHPSAIFVQKLLVVLHTELGRKILFGNTLKIIENGIEHKKILTSAELLHSLGEDFKLSLEGVNLRHSH